MKSIINWLKQLFMTFRKTKKNEYTINTDTANSVTNGGEDMEILNNYHDSGVIDELGNALAFVIANIATDGVTTSYTVPTDYLRDAGSYVVNVNQTAYSVVAGGSRYPQVTNLRFDGTRITWGYRAVSADVHSTIRPQIILFKVIAQ